jgi:hypothetical protein
MIMDIKDWLNILNETLAGPLGCEVISLQQVDSLVVFELNGELKRFLRIGPEGFERKTFKKWT